MKIGFFIIAMAALSFGCATRNQSSVKELNETLHSLSPENTIYERLRAAPIPLPAITPFDADPKQRELYIKGFDEAWGWVISGAFLHGTRAFIGPTEQEKSFQAGWKDGYIIAGDRWMQEFEIWRKENSSQTNSPP